MSNPRKYPIFFTLRQIEDLSEILSSTQDCGPDGYGWASRQLEELRGIVIEAESKAKTEALKASVTKDLIAHNERKQREIAAKKRR